MDNSEPLFLNKVGVKAFFNKWDHTWERKKVGSGLVAACKTCHSCETFAPGSGKTRVSTLPVISHLTLQGSKLYFRSRKVNCWLLPCWHQKSKFSTLNRRTGDTQLSHSADPGGCERSSVKSLWRGKTKLATLNPHLRNHSPLLSDRSQRTNSEYYVTGPGTALFKPTLHQLRLHVVL